MASSDQSRRQRLLLGVLIVLFVVVVYQYKDALMPGESSRAVAGGRGGGVDAHIAALGDLPTIALERDQQARAYDRQRDLFQFGEDPVSLQKSLEEEARRQEQLEERERRMAEAREKQMANRQPDPTPREPREPPPPPFRYEYEGFIARQPGGGALTDFLAVLQRREGKDTVQLVAAVGETIDDEFIVREIDRDRIVVGYTSPRHKDKTQTVEITESPGGGGRAGRRRN